VAKAQPSPGTGNVQGIVLFDEKPAVGVTATLCEKFDQYLDGCSGQQFSAKTTEDGSYVIANVPPATYAALTVNVFDTDDYIYAQSGILTPQTYTVAADKTVFVDPLYLWKSDLNLVSPAAGSSVSGIGLVLRWSPYTDAAYYKVTVSSSAATDPVSGERVDGTSYNVPAAVPPGTYDYKVEAYDSKDHKIAESPDGVNFTVSG
jgi:hypothetical protein